MKIRKLALAWALMAALVGTTLALAVAAPAHAACPTSEPDCERGTWSGGTTASGTTVTGLFRYSDRDAINASFLRPISFAKVEIWRYRPGWFGVWSWNHDATSETQADGRFSVKMPYEQSGIKYAVRVFATNPFAVVWPSGGGSSVPFWTEPGPVGTPIQKTASTNGTTIAFDFDFSDDFRSRHFNLAETAIHGGRYVNLRRGEADLFPRVNMQPGSEGSWYTPRTTPSTMGAMPWIPTSHDGCLAKQGSYIVNSPEHAWMEGFANYLAQAIVTRTPEANLRPSGGTIPISRMETPSCGSEPAGLSGDAIEVRVAGVIWDLFDSRNESGDASTGMDLPIFQIMDNELDADRGQANPTINKFRAAWVARGLSVSALDSIMALNGVPIR
ncbi:MAG: hypothetical protein M3179_02545 [Actinomycetota bacterium]|nr:hypothetical protein [Actinomycetota bacterium]